MLEREPQYDVFADAVSRPRRVRVLPRLLGAAGLAWRCGADVTGKRVLDAACGPGLSAAELIGREALVVGFDHSPRMVEICRKSSEVL